jgi:hypothetical protein
MAEAVHSSEITLGGVRSCCDSSSPGVGSDESRGKGERSGQNK